jgi:hypothetical protein
MRLLVSFVSVFALLGSLAGAAADTSPSPNGIAFPEGYQDWPLIAVSHRIDNESLRAILGNDVAIQAARQGETNPWPDGAILAKIVWQDSEHEIWEDATVPGELLHVEFMIKDAARFSATAGWGFARWLGADRAPFGEDADFAEQCVACHEPMEDNDYVFSHPVSLP